MWLEAKTLPKSYIHALGPTGVEFVLRGPHWSVFAYSRGEVKSKKGETRTHKGFLLYSRLAVLSSTMRMDLFPMTQNLLTFSHVLEDVGRNVIVGRTQGEADAIVSINDRVLADINIETLGAYDSGRHVFDHIT